MADNCLLLVEGLDDEHVFYHLLEHYRIPECFKIANKQGIDRLLSILPTLIKGNSNLERLGIVVDADTNIEARWTALRRILLQSGQVDVPPAPDRDGTIVVLDLPDRKLTVGIWIMPDNQLPGMLEDFIQFLVPANDSLWVRASDCLAQIPERERRFPQEHQSKARVHTWLAWQKEPGTPLGQAITKRYLDADAPHAQRLMGWLCRLFDLEL